MGIPNSQKNYNEKLYLADKQFFKSKKKIFKRRKTCHLYERYLYLRDYIEKRRRGRKWKKDHLSLKN